jgi:hypothetical protein
MMIRTEDHSRWWLAALILVYLLAAWLRMQQLSTQVLLDDEWHALHALFRLGYREIALSFGLMDHSIPLALLYQAIADTTGLDEPRMRLPSLLAGLATVAAGSLWAWRRFGPPTGLAFAWLLAISPLLVIYSRAARPYALVVLLALLAFWAAHAWWYRRRNAALWVYAACAAVGTWLHPLFGPTLMSPLLFFALDGAWKNRRPWPAAADLRRLVSGAVLTGLMTAMLVVPPLIADPSAILGKAGVGELPLHTLLALAQLLAGTGSWLALALFLALAFLGAVVLLKHSPRYVAFVAIVLLTFLATLLIARPAWTSTGYVLARYTIVLLPGLLLAVAVGLAAVVRQTRAAGPAAVGITLAGGLLLAWGSPLPETWRVPGSHGFHTYYIAGARPDTRPMNAFIDRMPQSPFWQIHDELLADPEARLALAPWRFEAPLSVLPVLERRTGRRVIPAFITGYCAEVRFGEPPAAETRVRLRNAVHLGRGEATERKAEYLVWKRRWHVDPEAEQTLAGMGLYADPLRLSYPDCEARFQADFGLPVYEDEWLAVYPLPGAR